MIPIYSLFTLLQAIFGLHQMHNCQNHDRAFYHCLLTVFAIRTTFAGQCLNSWHSLSKLVLDDHEILDCMESFHSLIKREWLNRFKIQNYQQAYVLVFEYITAFYNTLRIHSHCQHMSSNDYEKLYANSRNTTCV